MPALFYNTHHGSHGHFAPADEQPFGPDEPPVTDAGLRPGEEPLADGPACLHTHLPGEARVATDWADVPEAVRAAGHAWWDGLEPGQRAALYDYTASTSVPLNKAMKACPRTLECLDNTQHHDALAIDAALRDAKPPQPLTVWRGLHSHDAERIGRVTTAWRKAVLTGQPVTLDGFVSATLNPAYAATVGPVVVEISTRQGAYLGDNGERGDELEFLMNHHTRFRVRGVEEDVPFVRRRFDGRHEVVARRTVFRFETLDDAPPPLPRRQLAAPAFDPDEPVPFAFNPELHPRGHGGKFGTKTAPTPLLPEDEAHEKIVSYIPPREFGGNTTTLHGITYQNWQRGNHVPDKDQLNEFASVYAGLPPNKQQELSNDLGVVWQAGQDNQNETLYALCRGAGRELLRLVRAPSFGERDVHRVSNELCKIPDNLLVRLYRDLNLRHRTDLPAGCIRNLPEAYDSDGQPRMLAGWQVLSAMGRFLENAPTYQKPQTIAEKLKAYRAGTAIVNKLANMAQTIGTRRTPTDDALDALLVRRDDLRSRLYRPNPVTGELENDPAVEAEIERVHSEEWNPLWEKHTQEVAEASSHQKRWVSDALGKGPRIKLTVATRSRDMGDGHFTSLSLDGVTGLDAAATWLSSVVSRTPRDLKTLEVTAQPCSPNVYGGRRAYHSDRDGVNLPTNVHPDGDWRATAVHEMGHFLESTVPGVHEAAVQFYWHRVGTEAPVNLATAYPDAGYEKWEEGCQDQFGKYFDERLAYYAGHRYPNMAATELVSMGLETLFRDPVTFARKDPEFCKFIVGILKGPLRKREDEL